jgi:osmotically-inducible protein OsmY
MSLTQARHLSAASCVEAVQPREERVRAVAEARLQESAYAALRGVCCEFSEGVLTLRGLVPRYYIKQLAQHLVGRVAGVVEIDNQLEVGSPLSNARGAR